MESIAARDDVARHLVRRAVSPVTDSRSARLEVVDADVLDLEEQRAASHEARFDEIVDDLVLSVDGNRAPTRQAGHVDPMARAVEGKIDAFVPQPLAREPPADADLAHQIDRALLEHARAYPFDDVLPAAVFEDDRVDALEMQQLPEHQSGRASADDADLGAGGGHGQHSNVSVPRVMEMRRRR